MKSYHLDHPGSINGVVMREGDVPTPGPGEALVRIRANSLNARDLGVVYGIRKIPVGAVPLTDGAGTVEALGTGAHRFLTGERVGTGADNEPLLANVKPIAILTAKAVREAKKLRSDYCNGRA